MERQNGDPGVENSRQQAQTDESSGLIRVLLVADTHLGFDLPIRPRVERRRRGPDFFANFERALEGALSGAADLVVHGGDLFFRSKVPASLVEAAMAPLIRLAAKGIPVYLVPGNHERSRIPLHLWTAHPNLHIFDQPRTFLYEGPKGTLALSGFPFARSIRDIFPELVRQTWSREVDGVPRLLCIHQTVEGAQVGVSNFTFRSGPDVVRGRDIPAGFCAVLCGHIHRAQVLTRDLRGRSLAAPVVYAGAVERTSFAERSEDKGYVIVQVEPAETGAATCAGVSFIPLPARPMRTLAFDPGMPDAEALERELGVILRSLDPDSVVRIDLQGPNAQFALESLSAARLREIAPPSMNVELALPRRRA